MRAKSTLVLLVVILTAGLSVGQGNAEEAESGGMRLPRKFGVGLTFYTQEQDYVIDSLVVGFPGFNPSMTKNLKVDNNIQSIHLRADYWVLPFLNVMGMVGRLDGETNVKISELQLPIPLTDLTIGYDGVMYGGGVTLAAGYKRYFATLTTYYTGSDLDITDSSVKALVIAPKAGVRFKRGAVWAGAMYQDAEEDHKGQYVIPGLGKVPFSVVLHQAKPWNFQVGARAGITEHIGLMFEGGLGNRMSADIHGEYRF